MKKRKATDKDGQADQTASNKRLKADWVLREKDAFQAVERGSNEEEGLIQTR